MYFIRFILQIHIGGLDNFLQSSVPLKTRRNFTGCMENVWFDYMNIIKDARMNQPRFQMIGAVMQGSCQVETIVPYTFPTVDAYLAVPKSQGQLRVRVAMDFRTYNKDGLLFLHVPLTGGRFMVCRVPYQLVFDAVAYF